jgi:hypothetical protein
MDRYFSFVADAFDFILWRVLLKFYAPCVNPKQKVLSR